MEERVHVWEELVADVNSGLRSIDNGCPAYNIVSGADKFDFPEEDLRYGS